LGVTVSGLLAGAPPPTPACAPAPADRRCPAHELVHRNSDTFRAEWRNRWLGKKPIGFRLEPTDGRALAVDLGGG
ncbi:MAG: hypothetical protein ACREMO_03565, partial [Gemmatimonadales bacterium]